MRHAMLRLMALGNHDHLGNVSAQISCVPWRPLHRHVRSVPPLQTGMRGTCLAQSVPRRARGVPARSMLWSLRLQILARAAPAMEFGAVEYVFGERGRAVVRRVGYSRCSV